MGCARLVPQPRPLFLRTDRYVAAPAIVLESHSALARRRHARPDAEPLSLTSVQRPGLALSPNPPSRAFVRPRRHSPDAATTPRFRPVRCTTAESGARYGYPLDRHHPSDVSLDRGGRVLLRPQLTFHFDVKLERSRTSIIQSFVGLYLDKSA